jgi:O-antigen/teichoic acid export membrane protein
MKRPDLPNKVVNPQEQMLNTDHLKTGMRARAVKSAGVTLAAQGVKLVLQLGSIAIMARLLQPSDFGLVAMVTVFTGFAMMLMEGGLSMATIQREEVSQAQVSNLFWINSALGAGLCLFGILISPTIATIYDEPSLILIMIAMSSTFFIGGISVQHDALLRRQMRFKEISIIDVVSMAFGAVIGIIAAFNGMGYWALVISPITTFTVKTIMRWFSARWRPSAPSRNSGVRPMLGFGAQLTAATFIGYITNNITTFAIGFVGGASQLGFYNRANTLTSMPSAQLLPPIINVLQPAIARIANEPDKLRKTLVSLMGKLVIVSTLITALMAFFADWIVLIFLGSSWTDAVPLFRFLAIYSFVQPLAGLIAVALTASGAGKAMVASKIHSLIITVAALLIGINWGVYGAVLAFSISGLLIRLPFFIYYATRYLPLSFFELAKPILPPLGSALVTIATLSWLKYLLHFQNPLWGMAILVPVFACFYMGTCLVMRQSRNDLVELITMLKQTIARKVVPA